MRGLVAGVVLVCLGACQVTTVGQDGPKPVLSSVARYDNGVAEAAVFIQTVAHTVRVVGTGIAPLPASLLTGEPTLVLPIVTLQLAGAAGPPVELASLRFDAASQALDARLDPGVPFGTYDVTVTNPSGQAGTLAGALQVVPPPTIDLCSHVTPAFGWIQGRTTVELCASNAAGHGLQPVPQVFLRIPTGAGTVTEVPLIRTAFVTASAARPPLADASVMTAVVPASTEARGAGLAVGGPYDLRVLNPDGSTAILPQAFTLLPDPPPTLTGVTPGQSDTGATGLTLTLSGANLKDPNAALSPRRARVFLLSRAYDPNDLVSCSAGSGCHECQSPVMTAAGQEVTCTQPGGIGAGSYVVHYQHLDDGSFGEFSAFAITNPAGNVVAASAATPLVQARMAHGAVAATDDGGRRYLYVVGGQSGPSHDTALSSVEVAPLSSFGDAGAWQALRSPLPVPTTGLSLVARGAYLFALGGRAADGNVLATVSRARVLGSDTVPTLSAPQPLTTGSLAAGTYTYRVSALMGVSTDNPGGEALSSDAESAVLDGAHPGVTLTWSAVPGATAYRVYRSPRNGVAGSEGLLADGVAGTSYTDEGGSTPAATKPLPAGALGVWVAMPPLSAPRADAAATVATDPNGTPYVYVLGGRLTAGSTEAASYEVAALTQAAGVVSSGSFSGGAQGLLTARAEAVVATLDAVSAPRSSALGASYVVVGLGASGATSLGDVEVAKVAAGGALGAFGSQAFSASNRRAGASGVLVSNVLFTVGGQFVSQGKTLDVCAGGPCADPPALTVSGGNSGFDFTAARYRGALVYVSGYFYGIGGQSASATVEASTDRTGYN
jgi:hypothetical protein